MPSWAIYVNLDYYVLFVCFKSFGFFHGFSFVLCLPSDCRCPETRHGCSSKGVLYLGRQLWHHQVKSGWPLPKRGSREQSTWGAIFWLVVNPGPRYSLQIVVSLFPPKTCGSFEGYFYFWSCGCHGDTVHFPLVFWFQVRTTVVPLAGEKDFVIDAPFLLPFFPPT